MSFAPNPSAVTVIRQVIPPITTLSVPFKRFGIIKFGGRATITKLQSGGLVVFSPVTLTDEIKDTVKQMGGQVSYLVAGDMEHHMNLGPWKQAYPSAAIIAPHDLREKRAKSKVEDVNIDYGYSAANKSALTSQLPTDFTNDFEIEYFDGHANQEIVLFHKPSRTMIEADFIFNAPPVEQYSKTGESPTSGILTRTFQWAIQSVAGKGQMRFNWYIASKPNQASFNQSVRKVDSWDFDRIIPCHGDVIEKDGKAVFRRLFAWHLAALEGGK